MLGTQCAGIAHDLNNLLSIIRGYVSSARGQIETAHPAQHALELAHAATLDAAAVTQRVLDFTRPRGSSHTPTNIDTAVRDTISLLRALVPKTIRIELETQSDVPPIAGESIDFQQIIANLCLNAARATPGGRGVVRIRIERVSLEGGECVRIQVIDWGCGMSEAIRARLFEPYFTTQGPNEGAGLGLFIVQQLVISLGGRISVQSAVGVGTEVTLHFPVLDPSQAPPSVP